MPLLLAFCLLSSTLLPALTAQAAVDIDPNGDPSKYGGETINVYRWSRVNDYDDIGKLLPTKNKRQYCFIAYDTKTINGLDGYGDISSNWPTMGTDTGEDLNPYDCNGNEYIDFNVKSGVFYTPSVPSYAWQIMRTGNTQNGAVGVQFFYNYPRFDNALFRIGGQGFIDNDGFTAYWEYNNSDGYNWKDVFLTSGDKKNVFEKDWYISTNSKNMCWSAPPKGYVRIIKHVNEGKIFDDEWQMMFDKDDNEWDVDLDDEPSEDDDSDYESRLKLFICQEIPIPAIKKDMTISSGTTFSIDNGVILNDNVTLTIEPGAVVTVKGVLYNNGCIHNYGTLIVDDGGAIRYFNPKNNTHAGKIVCQGGSYKGSKYKTDGAGYMYADGNLLVLEGGTVEMHDGDITNTNYGSLQVLDGGSCINRGKMTMPHGVYVYEGYFINQKVGTVNTGRTISSSASQKERDYYNTHYLSYIEARHYALIENKGTWNNYCDQITDRTTKIDGVRGGNGIVYG